VPDPPLSASPEDFIDVSPGMRWECIGCGTCCGNNFTRSWLDHCVVPITGPLVDGHCRHFDRETRRCGIYYSRPAVCRGHPFALRRMGDSHRLQVHRHCPGIDHGDVLDRRALIRSLLDTITELYDMDFMVDWETVDTDAIRIYRIK
jgi:Fe-S-cluster containining protein